MSYRHLLPHLYPQWLPRLPRLSTLSLQALRQQHAQRRQDRAKAAEAAHEACASEGAEVDLRMVELDGQHFQALYRNDELVCLLPPCQPQSVCGPFKSTPPMTDSH
jgi:hypothetical protein